MCDVSNTAEVVISKQFWKHNSIMHRLPKSLNTVWWQSGVFTPAPETLGTAKAGVRSPTEDSTERTS